MNLMKLLLDRHGARWCVCARVRQGGVQNQVMSKAWAPPLMGLILAIQKPIKYPPE